MIERSVHYKYRLNENSEHESLCLETVNLIKNEWTKPMLNKVDKLDKHIRTKVNPEGIVDFQKYIPADGKILKDSYAEFTRELDNYTMEQLLVKKRPELNYIAESYGIDPVNKSNQFLTKLIVEAQDSSKTYTITQVQNVQDKMKIKIAKNKTPSKTKK